MNIRRIANGSYEAQLYAIEAVYHQRVAAMHGEMAREWIAEGEHVLGTLAQRLAAGRYASARECVDGFRSSRDRCAQ